MTQKPYLDKFLSSDSPSGGHYRENAPSGDLRAPRNTSFSSNLSFSFSFYEFFSNQILANFEVGVLATGAILQPLGVC